jgi:hypothetical protein
MEENIGQSHMLLTQSGEGLSQRLDGVRKAAKNWKQEQFTALLHHLSIERDGPVSFASCRKSLAHKKWINRAPLTGIVSRTCLKDE